MTEIDRHPFSSEFDILDKIRPQPVWVWGLPLLPVTLMEAVGHIDHLIHDRKPGVVVTANVHYAMLTARNSRLQAVNAQAAFLLGDGAPLVWAARRQGTSLPERVTGADLTPALCRLSARRAYRVFLLGGKEGVAVKAARRLREKYPGLHIVGIATHHIHSEEAPIPPDLYQQIHEARPDLLFASLGQPKGELWLTRHCQALAVPVSIQIGATFDFLAGIVPRAPRWMQRVGLEWAYRLNQEPRRLMGRYARNAIFAGQCLLGEIVNQERTFFGVPGGLAKG